MPRLGRIKTFRDKEDHREDWSEDFNDIEQRVDAVRRVSSDLYKKMSSLSAADDEKRLKKAPLWPVKLEFENAEKCITSDSLLQSVFSQMRLVLDEVSNQYKDHLHDVDNAVLVPLKNLEDECKRLSKERKLLTQQYSDLKYRRDQLPSDPPQTNVINSLLISSLATSNATSGSPQINTSSQNPMGSPVSNGQMSANNPSTTMTSGTTSTDGPSQKVKDMTAQLEELIATTNMSKDNYLKDLYNFAASDRERSRIFMKYIELQREYHQQCYTKLSEQMEEMDKVIKLRSMKTVFGVDLKTHLRETNRTIAYVLQVCIEGLLNPHSIREQGIFRVSPGKSRVGHLLSRLNVMPLNAHFLREFDAITLANALKNYIGKLPETLLGEMDPHLWQTAGEMDEKDGKRVETLRDVVKKMDPDHSTNLAYLCQFLHRLTDFSSSNNMDAYNLSVVFAPNFFQGTSGLIGPWQLGVTKSLIVHCAQIFPQSDDWLQKFDLDDKPQSVAMSSSNEALANANVDEIPMNVSLSQIPSKLTKSVDTLNDSTASKNVPLPLKEFTSLKGTFQSPAFEEASRHVRNLSADINKGLDLPTDLPTLSRVPESRSHAPHASIRRSTTKKAPPPPPINQVPVSQVTLHNQTPPAPPLPPPPPPPTSLQMPVSPMAFQTQAPPVPSLPPPPPPPTLSSPVLMTHQTQKNDPSLTGSPQLRLRASTESGDKIQTSTPTPTPRRTVQSTMILDTASPTHAISSVSPQTNPQRENVELEKSELSSAHKRGFMSGGFVRNASLRFNSRNNLLNSEPLKKLSSHSPSSPPAASSGTVESNSNASPKDRNSLIQSNPVPAYGRPKPVAPENKINQPISSSIETDNQTNL